MAWSIEGDYFENCSCDVPCPCTVSLDLGADYDRCNVCLVFTVNSGEVEGVDVSGVTVVALADTPKLMSEGNWRLGVLISDNASDEQAEKLLPWKGLANRGVAILLAALALGVAFAPEAVPGLTVPDDGMTSEGMAPSMDR